MELKRIFVNEFDFKNSLLIVPYGIETFNNWVNKEWVDGLLIVPYGIETVMLNQCSVWTDFF